MTAAEACTGVTPESRLALHTFFPATKTWQRVKKFVGEGLLGKGGEEMAAAVTLWVPKLQ